MKFAYYNDNDERAAAWLRQLIKDGLIPDGEVDTRSIADVQPDDLKGFQQVHLFAGIGGWPWALRLAAWPNDRPIWTASCPCPPFSNAGKRASCPQCKGRMLVWCPRRTGFAICADCQHAWLADARHLWPEVWRLAAIGRPKRILGEQVASVEGIDWIAGIRGSMEVLGYHFGVAALPACSVGAAHIRHRLFWVADADRESGERRGNHGPREGIGAGDGQSCERPPRLRATCPMADASDGQLSIEERGPEGRDGPGPACALTGSMAHADGGDAQHGNLQRSGIDGQQPQDRSAVDALGDTEGTGLAVGECVTGNAGEDSGSHAREGFEQASGGAASLVDAASGGCARSDGAIEQECGPGPGREAGPMGNAESGGLGIIGDAPFAWARRYFDRSVPIHCADGKWRRVPADETGQPEPTLFPLAYALPGRVGLLRGSGNAIDPLVGAVFVQAVKETLGVE